MTTMWTQTVPWRGRDRRRQDVLHRAARWWWGFSREVGEALANLPCRAFGHAWWEVPQTFRRSTRSDGSVLRFECKRCHLASGARA